MDRDPDELLQHIRGQLAGGARQHAKLQADPATAMTILSNMKVLQNGRTTLLRWTTR